MTSLKDSHTEVKELERGADLLATAELRDKTLRTWMMGAWSLTILLRGLDMFSVFKSVRRFYVILIESFKDSKPFLVLLAYIMLVFAFITSLLDLGNKDKTNVIEQGLIVFADTIGGYEAPDAEELEIGWVRSAHWVLFVLLALAANIIALNSLIAILGDSYEKVQSE